MINHFIPHTMTTERTRVTVSIPTEALEVYKKMAAAGGMSVSYCLGEWLADTVEGAQFLALKMEEARRAPKAVMREMQAMASGLQEQISADILTIRKHGTQSGHPPASASGAGRDRAAAPAPSSNTGLKSPPKPQKRAKSL